MTPQIGGVPDFPSSCSTKIYGIISKFSFHFYHKEIFPGRNQHFAEIVQLGRSAEDVGGQLITSIEFTFSFNLLQECSLYHDKAYQ